MMINDQINIAIRTRETLRNQRSNMKFIQTQLTTLASMKRLINNYKFLKFELLKLLFIKIYFLF